MEQGPPDALESREGPINGLPDESGHLQQVGVADGLGAVLTATDVPFSPSVAPASWVFRGPALAVDPMSGSALGLGLSSNVTPAGVGVPGVQPKAVDPTRRFGPRPKAEHLGRLIVDS